ncbi:MAG: addiction module toxin RelE [Bacteroides sp.]|nr:addiction module toxin RelE [Bacteroides sp.]
MNYEITTQPTFLRALKHLNKKYKSLKQDLQRLQTELLANPQAGTDLGNDLRKVRMTTGSKNRGKNHGARVITYTYSIDQENGIITLLTIYDKEERESISSNELMALLAEARASSESE